MPGSALILQGAVDASPFGKFHAVEGTYDSTVYVWDSTFSGLTSVPANGAVVPNLLRDRAATVSGLTAAQCDFAVINNMANGFAAGEITGAKGIHIASTQAGAQNAVSNFGLCLSPEFANWLLSQTDAGADYGVMFTQWLRCTRAPILTGNTSPQSIMHFASTTVNRFITTGGGVSQAGVALATNTNGPSEGSAGLMACSSQGWSGVKPANMNSAFTRMPLNYGAYGPWDTQNYNKAASYIGYRCQVDIVDLSDIAGADRVAKGNAMVAAFQAKSAEWFGAGGRFAGDTFTPAAALKP